MKSRLFLAAVLAATACTPQLSRVADTSGQPSGDWLRPAMPGTACRVPGGDGQMLLAERGIGGTGPITKPPARPDAGNPPPATGVAAVITGFGSICLAGLEVDLAPQLAVSVDGAASAPLRLAAGERAVLVAQWQDNRPVTAAVAIRHEIVGPVERVMDDGTVIVAGQVVHVAEGAWVTVKPVSGMWVAVSGLPQPDGGVLASRIDSAVSGAVLLHGRLRRDGQGFSVGTLPVMGRGLAPLAGRMVRLTGQMVDGGLEVTQAVPDQLQTNPATVFGGGVSHYAIQALVSARGGAFAVHMALPPGTALPASAEPAVLGLVRAGPTDLAATSVSVSSAQVGGIGAGMAGDAGAASDSGIGSRGFGTSPIGLAHGPGGAPSGGPGPGGHAGP